MSRQKCLLWNIADQASPLTVLRSFQRLSQVFKHSVSTDLPRSMLPRFIGLAGRVKGDQVGSVQFTPPLISTADPDFAAIRALSSRAVRESGSRSPHHSEVHILGKSCT
jgi:hypothetical protein